MPGKKVVVYSSPTCPYCKKAKDYLNSKGIAFEDVNVAEDRSRLKEMMDISHQRGVPVIVVDNDMVIGFDESSINRVLAA